MSDPWSAREEALAHVEPLPTAPGADYIDRIEALDRHYGGANLRLQCLSFALMSPDGAPPPGLLEVIARAEAYWKFVCFGGSASAG